jgi:hypothetical protein
MLGIGRCDSVKQQLVKDYKQNVARNISKEFAAENAVVSKFINILD